MAIPKKIHFIWAGGTKPLPPENAERIKEWAKQNPGFEVTLWIDKETTPDQGEALTKLYIEQYGFGNDPKIILKDITEEGVVDEHSRYHIDKTMPNYGASSDILRYAILKKLGGVYFDSDNLPGMPLNHDGLFESDREQILKINQFTQGVQAIGNDGFICTPEHPFMIDLYEAAKHRHREVAIAQADDMYDFDSFQDLLDPKGLKINGRARMNWTIDCTGPEAVRQVCESRGMLDSLDKRKTADPDYILDKNCFKPLDHNEGNWLRLRITHFDSPEKAIQAALNEIHFETKHMGFLVLDYHIKLIVKSLEPTSLTDNQIAEQLISALKEKQLDLTHVTHIQLLSPYPAVRAYYKQYTPHLDDDLIARFTSLQLMRPIVPSGSGDIAEQKQMTVDYAKHILNAINISLIVNPQGITIISLTKLLALRTILTKTEVDETVADMIMDIKNLTKKVLELYINNHFAQSSVGETQINQVLVAIEKNSNKLEKLADIFKSREELLADSEFVEFLAEHPQSENIIDVLDILSTISPSLIDKATISLISEYHADPLNFACDVRALNEILPSLINNHRLKLLADPTVNLEGVKALSHFLETNSASFLVTEENFLLILKYSKHGYNIENALSACINNDIPLTDKLFKDILENGQYGDKIGRAIGMLRDQEENLKNDINISLILQHAQHAGQVAKALDIIFRRALHIYDSNKNFRILLEHSEHAEKIGDSILTIARTDTTLLTDDNFRLLSENGEHATTIASAIKSLFAEAKSLINDEAVLLLATHGKNAELVVSKLKILGETSPELMNHMTLKLLAESPPDSIVETTSRLAGLYKELSSSHYDPRMLRSTNLAPSTADKLKKFLQGDKAVDFNQQDIEALDKWKLESKCASVIKLGSLPRVQSGKLVEGPS